MNKNRIYIYIYINNINLSLEKKIIFSNISEVRNHRIRIEIFQIKDLYPVSHVKIDTDRNIEESIIYTKKAFTLTYFVIKFTNK